MIRLSKKQIEELKYQKNWVKIFETNPSKVLDYWKIYRDFDKLSEICNFNDNQTILDIGCGISTVLYFLPGTKYGIDTLADVYKTLNNYPKNIQIINAKAEKIPFENEKFDLIFCSNALDHCDHMDSTLKEVYRTLKKDGLFVVAVEVFKRKKDRGAAHPYCLHDYEILNRVKKNFSIIYKKQVRWVGLREFYQGELNNKENELIFIGKK